MSEVSSIAKRCRDSLLCDVIPFWVDHSPDYESGGYFTCLDRNGNVFDTEKYLWLQCRQVWMLSALFDEIEPRDIWLDLARLGAEFLKKYGRDEQGEWYYALLRDGRPFMHPFSIFTDGFAAMGMSRYARITGDDEFRSLAERSYDNYCQRMSCPKGRFGKVVPGSRVLEGLALRMLHLNLLLELEWQLETEQFQTRSHKTIDEVMKLFLDRERMVLFENVAPDGSHPDCPEGRLINPGHGLEVLWMTMLLAKRVGRDDILSDCVEAVVQTAEYGWDQQFGGFFYRRDALGKPLYQIEWDQKMWWVHAEAMVAFALGYALSDNQKCLDWLIRTEKYVCDHYVDRQEGEWFGYLNRRGEVLLDVKGTRWKGCFHVPRALMMVSQILGSKEPVS